MSNDSTISVSREIPASAGDIFAILSNPERHADTDSTGGVRSVDKGQRLTQVGDTFRMNMVTPTGDEYQTDNTVFAFVPDRTIGWRNDRNVTKDVLVGSKWLYELDPQGADSTNVTLTYDTSELESDGARAASKNFDASVLGNSLAALAEAVA